MEGQWWLRRRAAWRRQWRQWQSVMGSEPGGSDFPKHRAWPDVTDERVRAAFAVVPRAAFIAPELRPCAGEDAPLPIGEGQTISQPYVVAIMVQALNLQTGDKVLEVGTGSGYETAILCALTATEGQPLGANVYAVERLPALARRAEAALHAQGCHPHLRVGDGAAGWPQAAPFAAVIVAAAAAHVPRPLWDQLADDGRMILPVGDRVDNQELWLLRKRATRMQIERLGGVRFVPLISPLLDDPRNWAEVQ
jgi:protein-L-isoaspartate(D-aspartate) O-methyltransferase